MNNQRTNLYHIYTLYISVYVMLSLIWVKINSFNEQRPLYSHYCLPWVMATFHYTPKSDFNLWQLPAVHRRRQPKQKFLHTQICHLPEVTTEANSYECRFCSLLTLVNSIFNVKRTYSEDKWRKVNIPKTAFFFFCLGDISTWKNNQLLDMWTLGQVSWRRPCSQ